MTEYINYAYSFDNCPKIVLPLIYNDKKLRKIKKKFVDNIYIWLCISIHQTLYWNLSQNENLITTRKNNVFDSKYSIYILIFK